MGTITRFLPLALLAAGFGYTGCLSGWHVSAADSGEEVFKSHAPHATPVIVSALVYEPIGDVRALVMNMLEFTEPSTRIVLHMNLLVEYTQADMDGLEALGGGRRVFVNPKRIAVRWCRFNITKAFLLNARFARDAFSLRSRAGHIDAIVVWQDSNMFFVRPCMEHYVRKTRCTLYKSKPCSEAGLPDFAQVIQIDALRVRVFDFLSRNGSHCPARFGEGYRSKTTQREGAVFSLALLIDMLEGLEATTALSGEDKLGGRWSEDWMFAMYASGREGCSGEKLCPFPVRQDFSQLMEHPALSDFMFKRVARSEELALGHIGVLNNQPQKHSKAIDVEKEREVRRKILGLRAPHNFSCTEHGPLVMGVSSSDGQIGVSSSDGQRGASAAVSRRPTEEVDRAIAAEIKARQESGDTRMAALLEERTPSTPALTAVEHRQAERARRAFETFENARKT